MKNIKQVNVRIECTQARYTVMNQYYFLIVTYQSEYWNLQNKVYIIHICNWMFHTHSVARLHFLNY